MYSILLQLRFRWKEESFAFGVYMCIGFRLAVFSCAAMRCNGNGAHGRESYLNRSVSGRSESEKPESRPSKTGTDIDFNIVPTIRIRIPPPY